MDNAGNTETAGTVTVLLDKTPPAITGKATTSPNANGWYNTASTVHFTCTDAVSGSASCQPDASVSAGGANQSVTGTAVDTAGNKGTTTVSGINVDTVAPVVTLGGIKDGRGLSGPRGPRRDGERDGRHQRPCAAATGSLSGGTANGMGTYTATATDKAGRRTAWCTATGPRCSSSP